MTKKEEKPLDWIPKSIQILIVDDSLTARKFMKEVLNGLGFKEITELSNGGEALDTLQRKRFDLVICDWEMPKMSGIDLFRSLREDAGQKHLRFLMVTSHAQAANVSEAIEAGVTSYVVKPYSAQTIEETLRQLFSSDAGTGVEAAKAGES